MMRHGFHVVNRQTDSVTAGCELILRDQRFGSFRKHICNLEINSAVSVTLVTPRLATLIQKMQASSDCPMSLSYPNASAKTTHHAHHPAEYRFAVESVFEKLKRSVRKNQMAT
jgi:hypothetical protein